jgi:hypothetical protein
VTLGTYGGATSVPVLAIDAKGRVTTASTSAITSGFTGFRNRIINGDMRIDQRNAGASHTPIANTYSIDRWNFQLSEASKLTAQRKSVTNPQEADNNTYLLNITSTSAYSVTSSDYFLLGQFIEGFNSADLGWGTSGAKSITISFWVYSSLTGTFGGSVQNSAIARSYPFSYTISSASTWEKKTITIAGDTSGTWVTDNGLGIRLYFGLGAGSTVSGTAGSWASANYLSATGAVSVVGTDGATFDITGVQLEAGSTATDFERRPIGTEFALCQRYFEKGTFHSAGLGSGGAGLGGSLYFRVEKRAAPTMAYTNTITSAVGAATTNVTILTDSVSLYRLGTANSGYQYEQTWTAAIEL